MRTKSLGNSGVRLVSAVVTALLGISLLAGSGAVGEGVRRGLTVCGGVLIPALFPFMCLSCFLMSSGGAGVLAAPLSPVFRRIFKLPGELGAVLLLSLLGGYPIGARMISGLLERGRIGAGTAERMLCFCVNCSPSFLISAAGAGILRDRRAGVILFFAHIIATLIIGMVVSARADLPELVPQGAEERGGLVGAFVSSVTEACAAMLGMCGFAVLFSGLLSMISALGLPERVSAVLPMFRAELIRALISGLFEVSAGCLSAAELGGEGAFILTGICASFGGLSVLFQVISCFGGREVRFVPMIISRIAHSVLSAAIALPAYRMFPTGIAAWAPGYRPVPQSDGKTIVIAICMLSMCSILVFAGRGRSGKHTSRRTGAGH